MIDRRCASACDIRAVFGVLVVLLGGCSDEDNLVDLKQYVAELDSKYKGHVEPLPQVKPYETFAYNATLLRDPFLPPAQSEPEEAADSRIAGIRPDFEGVSHLIYSELDVTSCERLTNR